MSPTHSATEGVRARSTPAGELREFFATAMESITPQLTFRRLIDGGDVVAVELTETWTHGGVGKTASVVAVFDLIDGRITRSKIYREGSADA
ncbi:nuclear transport factor 2 family protein [Brevibacterium casei]